MSRRNGLDFPLHATTNAGLWLDVFPSSTKQKDIGEFLQHFARCPTTGGTWMVPGGYERAFERREAALRRMSTCVDGITRMFEAHTTGRMIVGIGDASVRETSVSLLRAWGLPYIPGSALKGVASQAAHAGGSADWQRPAKPGANAGKFSRAIFGDVTNRGAVVFHDAWWIPSSVKPLHMDVMTPHHKAYNSGDAEAGPMDWDEPTPISFLSVSGSFAIALSGPAAAIEVVQDILTTALKDRGVGAKTRAGYGRMKLLGEKFTRGHTDLRALLQENQPHPDKFGDKLIELAGRDDIETSQLREAMIQLRSGTNKINAGPWANWLRSLKSPALHDRLVAPSPPKDRTREGVAWFGPRRPGGNNDRIFVEWDGGSDKKKPHQLKPDDVVAKIKAAAGEKFRVRATIEDDVLRTLELLDEEPTD